MIVKQGELDVKPKEKTAAGGAASREIGSTGELIVAHDKAVADTRLAVSETTDEHLNTPWKLLEGGNVVDEGPRYRFIVDNFTHLAHHRGQLTVYLRLLGAQVPAIYGPSADDHRF
jgi:uncharacterized damage-inducible protein DinB